MISAPLVVAAGSGIGSALVSIMTTIVRNPMVIAATIACLIGIALDMTPTELMTVMIMAGLPTAQNALIAAMRSRAAGSASRRGRFSSRRSHHCR